MSRPASSPFPLGHPIPIAPGLSEAQTRAIWRVVAEARAGQLEPLEAHAELVTAGYTPAEAEVLVEEVLERLLGQGTGARPDRR